MMVKTGGVMILKSHIGSLSRQYNVCSSPGCRCKASPPRKHGPYYQLSYTRNGKSTTEPSREGASPNFDGNCAAMPDYVT